MKRSTSLFYMKPMPFLLFAFGLCLSCQTTNHRDASSDNQSPFDTSEYIANLKVLSSDSLEGRLPGTAGGNKAAEFIASQFKSYGLLPFSKEQGFLQPVEIESLHPVYSSARVTITGRNYQEKLEPNNDILFISNQPGNPVRLDGDLVFAGFGIVAPEYNWDDYKDVDIKDKIVVCLMNHPDFLSPSYRAGNTTYYGTVPYRAEAAFRKGARAILIVFQKDGLFNFSSWRNFLSIISFGPYSLRSKIPVISFVTEDAFDKLIRKEKLTTEGLVKMAGNRDFKPFTLPLHMNVSFDQENRKFSSPNVVGMVKGTLKPDQAVIFMAHYDHLGILKPINGDSIYNGAIDNGSGTAGIMSLAHYFSKHPAKRSIIFIATTAEEMGFQGAFHYLNNPAIPLDHTIAGVNLDMMNFIGKIDSMELKPLIYTDAVNTVKGILEKKKVKLLLSDFDGEYINFRVESYPFALHDILLMNLVFEQIGKKYPFLSDSQLREIINSGGLNYHRPNDEIKPWFRYDGILQQLDIAKEIGLWYANDGEKPAFMKENPYIPAKKMWLNGN